MAASTSSFYQVGASLPVDAPSYVKRLADEEFYQKLKAGKFCYVLNSRQMGKSSLRVQTMQRLQASGTVCAAIDLTGIGKHQVTLAQWYGGIVYALVESCQLEDKFDFDWQTWWQKHQEVFDPVMCLRLLIEKVLLVKISQQIVIFVDEIDTVLSQKFSLDDFFALIRFFQNQRVDNPAFERLTFALLGVATPSDLITDKTQTPFNIGEAIELHGFQIDEVEPLIQGLRSRFRDPQAVMKEILDWTGGQPFLTQKLCRFMVEESEKENPRAVESVVRTRIIENWESLDEPEHLRTIRDRILRDEQRAPYLLELYQQIRLEDNREVIADNTLEQSELQLSGLVVRQQNKLRVYNPIYRDVFDQTWIETQLRNLRPYSENFKFWVASGGSDDSRLLRGKALQDALEWSRDKSLSYQDRQFLAASQAKEREEEIAALEKEAALERERKDREATEKRNQVLSEANQTLTQANKKAKQQIRVGSVVLIITLLGAVILGRQAVISGKKVEQNQQYLTTSGKLAELAGQLEDEGSDKEAKELFSMAGQSVNIKNPNLQQTVLNTGISYAYLKLKNKNLSEVQNYLDKVKPIDTDNSPEALQIRITKLKIQGNLSKELSKKELYKKNIKQAITYYQKAFYLLKTLKDKRRINNGEVSPPFNQNIENKILSEEEVSPPFNQNIENKILSKENVEAFHREFLGLLSEGKGDKKLYKQVEKSLQEHYYNELDNLLANEKWEEADKTTSKMMFFIAYGISEGYGLDDQSINKISCLSLQKIDYLWKKHSDGRFGFGVQNQIWRETGNRLERKDLLGITKYKKKDYEALNKKDDKALIRFLSKVGWIKQQKLQSYRRVIGVVEKDYKKAPRGVLPTQIDNNIQSQRFYIMGVQQEYLKYEIEYDEDDDWWSQRTIPNRTPWGGKHLARCKL